MKIRPANDAFTLVELAIVLAIIGVLAGGITIGASLIQRAKVNQVATGVSKYGTALLQFQQQYQALPGDYVDATEQWGAEAGNASDSYTATCYATVNRTPKKVTCNGNGNNQIGHPGEPFRGWQHLSNAGLVEGMYTGTSDITGGGGITGGENAPAGPLPNTAYHISTGAALSGHANYYDQPLVNQVTFGTSVAADWPYGPALTPKEQYGLDTKIDDGKPSTGAVRSLKSPRNPNCTTSDVDASAEYALVQGGRNCAVMYFIQPN